VVNFPLDNRILNLEVERTSVLSDHYPIIASLGIGKEVRGGRSRYRLDPKWLDIKGCRGIISNFWLLDKGIEKKNTFRSWNDKMNRVKKICQELSIIRNKKVNNTRRIRLERIHNIRKFLEEDPTNSKLQLELSAQLREEEIW